jgi:hypothetical protein
MFLKVEDFMLPCLNKKLFGIECLGCGFQRSLVLLFQGNFKGAFLMYPAIFTLLLLLFIFLIQLKYKFKSSKKMMTVLVVMNVLIMVISYFLKMKPILNL